MEQQSKPHLCVICKAKCIKPDSRIRYGQRYCSLECEDLGEEKNQGNATISNSHDNQD